MKNKYSLTKEENVFLAKKRWDESIYSGMRMENRNVTFPQTQTILEGINVAGVELDDIQAILNMRDAWRYLLDHLEEQLDLDYLCKLQEKVAYREALAWGELRTGSIGISGVKYVPPIPDKEKVEEELRKLLSTKRTQTEIALDVFAWVARSQLFWDGNKRTAILAANKILIESGAGILLVPDAVMLDFSSHLSAYYESGNPAKLKKFLFETSIFGIDKLDSGQHEQGEEIFSLDAHDAEILANKAPATNVNDNVVMAGNSPTYNQSKSKSEPEKRTANWLKNQRKQKQVTQKDLAEAVGAATNSIANIEQGQRKGSDDLWSRIEKYFAEG